MEYLQTGEYSIKELAKKMKCNRETVIKYAHKIGGAIYLNSKQKVRERRKSKNDKQKNTMEETYKGKLVDYKKKNPQKNRKELRQELKKEYAFLYRNNKEWLMKNLPQKIKRGNNKEFSKYWELKDLKILNNIKEIYEKSRQEKIIEKLTISRIGKILGCTAILQKKIDKIPLTKKYLEEICAKN